MRLAPARRRGKTELTLSRLTTTMLLAGIAGFAGLYLASIGPYWNISPDSASYVRWGSSLAAGAGWGSPPLNPPLTALVFAAVLRLFPTGYTALNVLTPLLIFLSLGFAYGLLERRGGRNLALLAILLSLAATPLYRASTQLLSEPVYMVFSMAALLLLDGYPDRKGGADLGATPAGPPRLHIWLAGVLLVATLLTRTIGITLALAVLLFEGKALLSRRGGGRPMVIVLAVLALLAAVLWEVRVTRAGMSSNFKMALLDDPWDAESGYTSPAGLVARIVANRERSLAIGELLTGRLSTGVHALDVLLRAGATLAFLAGLLIALQRHVTITGLYVLLYVAVVMLHVLKGDYGPYRHLVPILPLLFYYALEAARRVNRSFARARPGRGMALVLRGLGLLFLFGYLRIGWDRATRGVAEAHYSPFGDYPIKRPENFDAQRLALWLKHNSRPEDRYAAAQRDMFDVLSERRGDDILLAHTHLREAFVARLDRGGVRYLLVDHSGPALGDSLLAVVRAYPGRFRLISELPAATLYEVTPIRKE